MRRSIVFLLVLLQGTGCVSSVNVKRQPPAVLHPSGLSGQKRVLVVGYAEPGGHSMRDEIALFCKESGAFDVVGSHAALSDEDVFRIRREVKADLVLTGKLTHLTTSTDANDRTTLIVYFLAWVITAPIGLGYAAATQWHASAAVEASMAIEDTRTDDVIWSRNESVAVNQNGKSLVSKKTLKESLEPAACRLLVRTMLNDFVLQYAPTSP